MYNEENYEVGYIIDYLNYLMMRVLDSKPQHTDTDIYKEAEYLHSRLYKVFQDEGPDYILEESLAIPSQRIMLEMLEILHPGQYIIKNLK